MTNRRLSMQAGMGRSPYLSFREAVRPAIVAHSLLLQEEALRETLAIQEKARAGELAELAGQVLSLTRDLLRKTGLGYVAGTATPKAQAGTAGGLGHQGSVLDAFADAAMMWAEIVGNCLALADVLLGQGRLDDVRALAAALADSGESGTAAELERRLMAAARDKYKEPLNAIHGRMTKQEIDDAIAVLSESLSQIPESPERNIWLNGFLPALAASALAHVHKPRKTASGLVIPEVRENINRLKNIAGGSMSYYPDNISYYISDIAGTFQASKP